MSENYVDDVSEVEPLAVFEETDEQLEEFRDLLWDHRDKPTKIPDSVDTDADDFDWDEVERVPNEERAARESESWFKFAYGYAGHGRAARRTDMVVFKLPGWFAADELGEWEEWWFGRLEVAKEDDGEWTAMCLSDIEPMKDRDEDSYFRNPIDEEWVPFSLIETAFAVIHPVKEDHAIFSRGMDSNTIERERGAASEADIVLKHTTQHYGRTKIVCESPFDAKDDFGALDFDQFHADWTGDNWVFDVEALWAFIRHMTLAGWSVCVKERVENRTSSDSLSDGPWLPEEDSVEVEV